MALGLIFIYPYSMMFRQSQGNSIKEGEMKNEALEQYIFCRNKDKKNLGGIKAYYSKYCGSLLFYKYKLAEQQEKIELVNDPSFSLNDKVLVADDSLKLIMHKRYEYTELDSENGTELLRITKIKSY